MEGSIGKVRSKPTRSELTLPKQGKIVENPPSWVDLPYLLWGGLSYIILLQLVQASTWSKNLDKPTHIQRPTLTLGKRIDHLKTNNARFHLNYQTDGNKCSVYTLKWFIS